MKLNQLHDWNVDFTRAVEIQRELAPLIRQEPITTPIRLVAGADVSHSRFSNVLFASVVVYKFPSFEKVEERSVRFETKFKYRTGLLSFREAPALLKAFEMVESPVDVAMLDGQGIAHPRRMGLASHVGLFLSCPTIGVGKTRLTGDFDEPAMEAGSQSPLTSRDELIGTVLRTKRNVRPLFISIGHRIELGFATDLVLQGVRRHRIPEPTRLAHEAVNAFRRSHATATTEGR